MRCLNIEFPVIIADGAKMFHVLQLGLDLQENLWHLFRRKEAFGLVAVAQAEEVFWSKTRFSVILLQNICELVF